MEGELMTIELKGLRFFAFHGLFAEERKIGNEFEIDVSVSYIPSGGIITSLSETINYVKIYNLARDEMEKPRDLLETFVMELAEIIHLSFPIKKVRVSLYKLHPPIPGYLGRVGVHYEKEY